MSVALAVPLMLVLTFTVLMIQLQSFSSLLLVLSVAPLGLIGVVAALLLSDKPLGFVAILGVLALTGMIARNSVILIDQIEKEKAQGLHPWDAVIEATTQALPPDPADRCCRHPRHDPDCADRLLGSDGLRDHGRPGGRDGADAGLPAGALRGLVPDRTGGSHQCRDRCIATLFVEPQTAQWEDTMIDESKPEDQGLAVVLIERFEHWILPRALDIKAKVDRGEKLTTSTSNSSSRCLKDAEEIKPHVDRAPEYQTLYTRVVGLYGEITKKGLENEQAEQGSGATG